MDINPSHKNPALRREVRKRAIKAEAWEALQTVFRARKDEGLTQADLARDLGKKPSQVCRALARPTNMGLETLAEYMDALGGYVVIQAVNAGSIKSNTCPPSITAPKTTTTIMIDGDVAASGTTTATDPSPLLAIIPQIELADA